MGAGEFDVMNEFLKVFIEALRRQAFSVLILIAGVVYLQFELRESRQSCAKENDAVRHYYAGMVESLRTEIGDCRKERENLAVEVAILKERINNIYIKKRI